MRALKIITLFVIGLSLIQCTSVDLRRRVVQQGNLLPDSKFKRLQIGMSKKQVATLMGTSLLSPMFNNNRWDYAFTKRKGGGKIHIKRAELFFTNARLSKIRVSKNY